ncbi:hypothetical protein TNCV_2552701 [Trichonephila clavipes]|nr:hypothetical protein TNCV_2552701 [Trichonephila clavipes]
MGFFCALRYEQDGNKDGTLGFVKRIQYGHKTSIVFHEICLVKTPRALVGIGTTVVMRNPGHCGSYPEASEKSRVCCLLLSNHRT